MAILQATIDGFQVEIDASAVRDYRVFEVLAGLESGDDAEASAAAAKIPWMANRLFGKEQMRKILAFIEERDGYPDVQSVLRFITGAFSVAREGATVATSDEALKN